MLVLVVVFAIAARVLMQMLDPILPSLLTLVLVVVVGSLLLRGPRTKR